MVRLPQPRRNVVFRVLSRLAGALALAFILAGFAIDIADADIGLEATTLLIMGVYVLGVQIYFLIEYFVETGGLEE